MTENPALVARAEEALDLSKKLIQIQDGIKERYSSTDASIAKLTAAIDAGASGESVKNLKAQLEEQVSNVQSLSQEVADLQQKAARVYDVGVQNKQSSPVEFLCASEEFATFQERKTGSFSLSMPNFYNGYRTKDIGSSDTSAGSLIQPDYLGFRPPAEVPLTIRDVLGRGTTTSNSIAYVVEKSFDNKAAPTPEFGTKPKSDIVFEPKTATVKTVAHYMRASKQALDDIPMLSSYINQRLFYGLRVVEEEQLLLGDGTGENFEGIIPQSTPFSEALFDSLNVTDVSPMDRLNCGFLQSRRGVSRFPPNAVLLNPVDWASVELGKDKNGNYLIANAQGIINKKLWGRQVIEAESIPVGAFLVGSFNIAAQLFDREKSNIMMSAHDADNFTHNAITIRGEQRMALCVYSPDSFVYGTLVKQP